MDIGGTVAPSYETLRPLKAVTGTPTFPVYADLADRLCSTTAHPDPVVAHVLGTCSSYAYADESVVAMMMARLGFEDNRCLRIGLSLDPMFIHSTAYLVQSADGRVVILCFRGTEPANLFNWLTDLDINPTRVPISFPRHGGTFEVHGGFYRNVRATRYAVVNALRQAIDGKSVLDANEDVPNRLEALYVTGHSLGGAMAALVAVMFATEPEYEPIDALVRSVYTFGQPMIGTPALAHACDAHTALRAKLFRYVYRRDVVPQLPPTAAGKFAHFGHELRYRGRAGEERWEVSTTPMPQLRRVLDLLLVPLGFLTRQIKVLRSFPLRASVDDHLPHRYVAALTPPGVRSEFGD